ncbi:MAG: thermonuclease family protein [Inquilinus sp.]|nr:thermonuclease family protein [Inquilinus sp.]
MSLLILSLVLSTQAAAQTPNVVSGDTLEFGGITMRLHGVVAPHLDEICMVDGEEVPVGRLLADALRDLIKGQVPDCRPIENRHRFDADFVVRCDIHRPKDSDGRSTVERTDLGRLMVEYGIAWEFIAESHLRYSPAEARAASAGRGVWASDCRRPWGIPPE